MTREETLKHFKTWCQNNIGNHCSNEDFQMANNIMALLEHEPCEDCISRQAALELFTWTNTKEDIWYGLKLLPSVAIPSAEQKTGHWINISNKDLHDYRTGNKLCFECSECRSQYTYKSNYCPNCGMVEPQESEEV